MRSLTCAALLWIAVAGPVGAQTPNADVMAPIQKFIDAFNKGDAAGAAVTHASSPDLSIVDEVPPYAWRGANAFQAWSTDLGNDAKKNGISDASVTLSAPSRVERNGDQAYVVVPAVYSFKQGGKSMRESAHMTFVVKKDASGWLIHSWTWTGPRPASGSGAGRH